jgi:hypothetical protein
VKDDWEWVGWALLAAQVLVPLALFGVWVYLGGLG